jgi:transposase
METKDFYSQLLGLHSPWFVAGVELDCEGRQVLIRVDHNRSLGGLCCGQCEAVGPGYDHGEERRWRHLDSCGFMTWLVARVPRVLCSQCGVQTVQVPWSTPHSRFTLEFENFAILVLQSCQVQSKAAALLNLSADQMHNIMERAVRRGLQRRAQTQSQTPLPYLGLDEKSIQAGHHYLTILSDNRGGRVLEVAEGRTTEAACELLESTLSQRQRDTVQAVAMDMWKGFANACQQVLPQAEIVHDRFHIAQYLNQAVDITRRREHRQLTRLSQKEAGEAGHSSSKEATFKGATSKEATSKGATKAANKAASSPLNKTKYVWLKNEDNLTDKQRALLEALRDSNLETVQVWGIKEAFREFFNCKNVKQGEAFFDNWCETALALKNAALNNVVRLLNAHKNGVLAYLRHRITNAPAEALNSRIQQIKFNARGFRKPQNFRIAILFFLGKLDLYPLKSP